MFLKIFFGAQQNWGGFPHGHRASLLLKAFRLRFWFKTSHPFARRFCYVRFLGIWKTNKHAIMNLAVATVCVRFTWYVLLVCARFLWPWQASRNVVLKLCFNVFMPSHVCAGCLVFEHR